MEKALQETRLLAAILAKNAVAKFWPSGLSSPILVRLMHDETGGCREKVMECLQNEPSDRVASQVRIG